LIYIYIYIHIYIKVSGLVHVLYEITIESTFENLEFVPEKTVTGKSVPYHIYYITVTMESNFFFLILRFVHRSCLGPP